MNAELHYIKTVDNLYKIIDWKNVMTEKELHDKFGYETKRVYTENCPSFFQRYDNLIVNDGNDFFIKKMDYLEHEEFIHVIKVLKDSGDRLLEIFKENQEKQVKIIKI